MVESHFPLSKTISIFALVKLLMTVWYILDNPSPSENILSHGNTGI